MGAADGREAEKEAYHSVVVVGAGVAGLQAARQLLPSFPDLLVIEASHRIGGRVKQVIGATLHARPFLWVTIVGEYMHRELESASGIVVPSSRHRLRQATAVAVHAHAADAAAFFLGNEV